MSCWRTGDGLVSDAVSAAGWTVSAVVASVSVVESDVLVGSESSASSEGAVDVPPLSVSVFVVSGWPVAGDSRTVNRGAGKV